MAKEPVKVKAARTSTNSKDQSLVRAKAFQRAASLLKQVSDPTRLQVVTLLSESEHDVAALCEQFKMTQPAVSHHLAMLRHGGIIERRRQGKKNVYALTETGRKLSKLADGVIR